MSNAPYVKWSINDRCNLRCPYCFINGEVPQELPIDEQYKMMDKMKKLGTMYIDFFGKEPLFDDRMFRLIEYARSQGYHFEYSFISNGKNLKKYTDSVLESGIGSFAISYDGGYGGREYLFDTKDIAPFHNSGVAVEFSIDVHRNSLPHMEEISEKLFKDGADSLYFKPIVPHEGSKEDTTSPYCISQEEFYDFVLCMDKRFGGNHMTFSFPYSFTRLGKKAEEQNVNENTFIHADTECTAGNGTIYIASSGECYGCGFIHYENRGKHSCDFLTATSRDINSLSSDGKCRFCVV